MQPGCGHPLCELIGGSCSIATGRSRGCHSGFASKTVAAEVFDEVRALVAVIARRDDEARAAAVRLAEIIRREARDDRNVLALARDEDSDLADALAQLCIRRR